ncbi:leucine-rich repeat domain-containing protein [Nonomuraea sp. NPDC049152]|uniref:leucine-rich repeat domain-containing protein n=1 Tax=Nonomuraea sp. NPDC049152 TaxID=3154350 RepID=UPI0033F919E7
MSGCRQVSDISPLMAACGLRRLDLEKTAVAHLDGITGALPELEYLNLQYCRSLQSVSPLSGLSRLAELWLTGCTNLKGLDDLGHHPHLTGLGLPSCPYPICAPCRGCPR